ncbi:hypothetical protein [Kitasatospora sp. NPDC057198]|uniref:hypothetical protein n=1 Tax=Kitasatospora sp. NPDC057198 TaxID=3346046 RepID=UPI0036350029
MSSMSDEEFAWWFGSEGLPRESRQQLSPYLRAHRGHPAYRGSAETRKTDNARLSRTGEKAA